MVKTQIDPPGQPITEVIGDSQTGLRLRIRQARVKVTSGPDKGREQNVPAQGLTVGKSTSCDLVLRDTTVSSVHLRIAPAERGYNIRDMGSRNGTWVNDVRVGDACLYQRQNIILGHTTLRLEILKSHKEFPLSNNSFLGSMIGQSHAMRMIFAMLERAAASDSILLLEGESGTGKELAAEAVHGLSSRSSGPFIVVDCGNIDANLLESQLFGHVKGAFTGATGNKVGAFEAARGGTVFLDEIGELKLELQPSLLRVIEKREVRRIGETSYRSIDVRLIAATNRNLQAEVDAGRFREDLFYRLSVLRAQMPPLRDRLEDIPLIARAMINQQTPGTPPSDVLSDEILHILSHHDWPGNVRELRNVVERLIVFRELPMLTSSSRSQKKGAAAFRDLSEMTFHDARNRIVDKFERDYAISMLEECNGIVAHAAQKAGVTRPTFHRLIRKHAIIKTKS